MDLRTIVDWEVFVPGHPHLPIKLKKCFLGPLGRKRQNFVRCNIRVGWFWTKKRTRVHSDQPYVTQATLIKHDLIVKRLLKKTHPPTPLHPALP